MEVAAAAKAADMAAAAAAVEVAEAEEAKEAAAVAATAEAAESPALLMLPNREPQPPPESEAQTHPQPQPLLPSQPPTKPALREYFEGLVNLTQVRAHTHVPFFFLFLSFFLVRSYSTHSLIRDDYNSILFCFLD